MTSKQARWILNQNKMDTALMSKRLERSETLCAVLANRGIGTLLQAKDFLYPQEFSAHDPGLIRDMDKAVSFIAKAISGGKRIVVYGDYDVDGVTSAYMLFSSLTKFGAEVSYYMPHREEDGYGLNTRALDYLRGNGAELVLCCDNGTSAYDEVLHANSLGMSVVILDHHEPAKYMGHDVIPNAEAVVNPKCADSQYPCRTLCAAAVCYKFLERLHSFLDADFDNSREMLIFAAIATICDVVELRGENRAIASEGLRLLNGEALNTGLDALIEKCGLRERKIGAFELGFVIGPCLNAAGRLASASLSLELLMAEGEKAEKLAERLVELNGTRKALTQGCVEQAIAEISEKPLDKVIVYFNKDIHESVAGIVAGRLREQFHRPVIVLTDSHGLLKGSARSIEGYNLHESLGECSELFIKFGGHEMAAGLTIEASNLHKFAAKINNACKLGESDFLPVYLIEKELRLDDITFKLAKELFLLEPYGPGNREPLFGTKRVMPDCVELIGKDKTTIRMSIPTEDGSRKNKAICFNCRERFVEMLEKRFNSKVAEDFVTEKIKKINIFIDIIYTIEINVYNKIEYLQIKVIDFRLSSG